MEVALPVGVLLRMANSSPPINVIGERFGGWTLEASGGSAQQSTQPRHNVPMLRALLRVGWPTPAWPLPSCQ